MSTPTSIIRICSGVRLNSSYEHTIYFSSREAQYNYFAGKVVRTFSAYSYLRKSWSIKVEATMREARTWSYLFFGNDSTGVYNYYFINNIEYINDSTVELFLELDVMQTYYFDFTRLPSFIERQHGETDEAGDNILDEGLELGEYISKSVVTQVASSLDDLAICMLSTISPARCTETTKYVHAGCSVGGVFQGAGIYAVDGKRYNDLIDLLINLDSWGYSDGIIAMWMYPKALINISTSHPNGWSAEQCCKTVDGMHKIELSFGGAGSDIDGYIPDNKKLLTSPFNLFYVNNNAGASALYAYEKFNDNTTSPVKFEVSGSLTPSDVVKIYPLKYKGQNVNFDEGISSQNYPSCAWNQDVYKLWLAQNQNMHTMQAISAMGMVGAGAVTSLTGAGALAGVGAMAGGVGSLASLLAQTKDAAIQPPQSKGSPASSTVNVCAGYSNFEFKHVCIDRQHAKAIDDYFTINGYKQNKIAVPNEHARKAFTYVKTNNCHIKGNFCNEDITKIESIYNHGITFWVNGDSIGNYSLSNRPLSEPDPV